MNKNQVKGAVKDVVGKAYTATLSRLQNAIHEAPPIGGVPRD